jgi:hypothetical protein
LLNRRGATIRSKPDEFYRLVERVTPAARYAAIFSTGGEGALWDGHGDQVGKHAPAEGKVAVSDKERIAAAPDPERACRVCGCTQDNACPGGCAWMAEDPGLCTACAPAREHVVAMSNPDGQSVARCSCGEFESRLPWGDHYAKQDAAVRAHWQDAVAAADQGGIPPAMRRRGKLRKSGVAA